MKSHQMATWLKGNRKKTGMRLRPQLEECEDRRLLSTAVVDLVNVSSYTMTIGFKWNSASSFSHYTLKPGAGEYFWTPVSSSLNPQVSYSNGQSLTFTTFLNAYGGYGIYYGSGSPPVSASRVYDFVNTGNNTVVLASAGTTNPELAVVDLVNRSSYTMTIGFRWSTASSFNYYTLKPGASDYFWTPVTTSLYPQVQYNNSVGNSLTITTNLNAYGGYRIYYGVGTPPISTAKVYDFLNNPSVRGGIEFVSG